MKVFLLGMPGAGKTTLGQQIAETLSSKFLELDQQIVEKEKLPIQDIFIQKGEDYFRQVESSLLKELTLKHQDFVMSTGGGAPCFFDNLEFMNQHGISLFIKVSFDELGRRLSKSKKKRPILYGIERENFSEELKQKFQHRLQYYHKAQLVFQNDRLTPGEIIFKLRSLNKLKEKPKG